MASEGTFETKRDAQKWAAAEKKRAKEIGTTITTRIEKKPYLNRPPGHYYYVVYIKRKNPGVKMRKAPKGWVKAKAVKVVKRNGKQVVLIKR